MNPWKPIVDNKQISEVTIVNNVSDNAIFADEKTVFLLFFSSRRFFCLFCNFSIFGRLLVLAGLVKVFHQVRNLVIVVIRSSSHFTKTCSTSNVAGQPLQMSQTLSSKLVQDSGQHLSNLFIFCVSGDSECVGGERSLYLGIVEMDHR